MPRKTKSPKVRELKPQEMPLLYPLIKQLNPDMNRRQFDTLLADMLKNHYRCVGAFHEDKLLGAIGFWVGQRFWCQKYMELDNVVVDINQRNSGIGKLLMEWIDAEAKRLGCTTLLADSYTHNKPSHRFYLRQRYDIAGFRFVKKLQ